MAHSARRARAPQNPALARYATIARLLTGRDSANADDGIDWAKNLCLDLKIPPLRAWGITEGDLPGIAEKAARASSMQANPLPLSGDEILAVLVAAL
jgi:alcohol dehydrogenase class IV